jgi:hypothetical protein
MKTEESKFSLAELTNVNLENAALIKQIYKPIQLTSYSWFLSFTLQFPAIIVRNKRRNIVDFVEKVRRTCFASCS